MGADIDYRWVYLVVFVLCAAASNIMRLADESSATKIGYLFV